MNWSQYEGTNDITIVFRTSTYDSQEVETRRVYYNTINKSHKTERSICNLFIQRLVSIEQL